MQCERWLSVCLPARDVHCAKTVKDSPMVCIEVEYEFMWYNEMSNMNVGVKISIGAIFDTFVP